MTWRIEHGDALTVLRSMPSESVQCCVTSPPYWGLRDYGVAGQLGLERTPGEYVEKMVEVFAEVRRVLRADGTLWLNLGDCYATGAGKVGDAPGGGEQGERWRGGDPRPEAQRPRRTRADRDPAHAGKHIAMGPMTQPNRMAIPGLKPKDLVGIPWRVAFALQADGWWLRSDIIWHKPNPMPSSVADRPTGAHELVFLLSKSESYFYDPMPVAEVAVSEPRKARDMRGGSSAFRGQAALRPRGRDAGKNEQTGDRRRVGFNGRWDADEDAGAMPATRNLRSVWTIASRPYREAHFATFPPELPERCILAGTSEIGCCPNCGSPWERIVEKVFQPQGDVSIERGVRGAAGQKALDESNGRDGFPRGTTEATTTGWSRSCRCAHAAPVPCIVLDPFNGAGTTGLVATRLGRSYVGIELNAEYVAMSERRIEGDAPLFNRVAAETP